jgi:hypothetical protein
MWEELYGSNRCGWEDNIRMDLGEIRYKGVVGIELIQDTFNWWASVNTVSREKH